MNCCVLLVELGFYDMVLLVVMLCELVDFDCIVVVEMWLMLCVVNVCFGVLVLFDNCDGYICIGLEYVMVSGVLLLGFVFVVIGCEVYWDGGIYFNMLLDVVLDDVECCDMLCFMVDFWDVSEVVF